MPDPVTHHIFAKQVSQLLASEINDSLSLAVFTRGALGPDPWSTLGFYGGKNKKYSVRSSFMHKTKAGEFLVCLAKNVKVDSTYSAFSFLAGAVCHYCLDKTTHPYIICKGGYYDGTKETRSQQGGHALMERAIDSYFIRKTYNCKPWRFSLAREIMYLKTFPWELHSLIDKVYKDVYGWDNSFKLLNRALKNERLFYTLMQDPLGLFYRVTGFFAKQYQVYSYYNKDIDSGLLDYMNLKNEEWQHPFDSSVTSRASFPELFDQAKKEAAKIITSLYNWIYKNEEIFLQNLLGNYNYSTGLDCDDARNDNKPECQPLNFNNKEKEYE